jgi:hypothetical protein
LAEVCSARILHKRKLGDAGTILVLKVQQLFHLFLLMVAGVRRSGRLSDVVVDPFHKVVAAS